ncbi:hypothetical protein B0A48_11412 [Cryoendolithus antarcticus]|uniref:Uncharacterized protein n=1 Tax=Cryoendolithus antarcticus TaxID=1507870 RepID=A0A1V8SVF5_9PEZI|nr:hypothetical protein B0A48_11412 [Cryoendolithus antarcticus]
MTNERRRSSVGNRRDLLVSHQLTQARPAYLAPDAFVAARVVTKADVSERLHEALTKAGLLLPAPPPGVAGPSLSDAITVDTSKFDRHFVKETPFLPAFALRRTVSLLFFWEEECMRMRALEREEEELKQLRSQAGTDMHDELDMRLEAVRMKQAMLPSQRQHETTHLNRPDQEELPAYD